ncbi:MAG: NADH-quinone oxidoreductase subunit NuoG [candidate division Zixibacteria bacterium]|nr:NADH-quinone oxidoreductase subunit NuoG [candidate division Zixibacteria bacterium]
MACATPVTEGMVVKTDTPKVKAARKGVLEFLLINHPLDCPVCDKGGECELQNLVFKYGSDKSRYVEEKRRFVVDPKSKYDDLDIGPQIVRNMNRCILCRKCVRFINEIGRETDLGTFGRAAKSEINVLPDIPVDNPYSGNTVEICPVGALTSKSFRHKTRVWELKATPSVCPLCADGCNINLWTKDDQIYRITSRRNDFVDEGFLCDKGRFGFEYVHSPNRLEHPLIRENGKLSPTDWDEAIELVASKLKTIREQSGADALAGIGSHKLTNEESYLFQKFFRVVVGTNNIDHRIHSEHALPNPVLNSGNQVHGMVNSIADIEKAGMILVLGCDLEKEHPIANLRVIKSARKGSLLFAANPESTRLGRFAKDELVYSKGAESALLNGLMEELGEKGQQLDKSNMSQRTGLTLERMGDLAQALAKAESIIVLCGKEIIRHPDSAELIGKLHRLMHLTGQEDTDGSGINLLWEGCNSQGASDCGVLPDRLPGYVDVADDSWRAKVAQVWQTAIPSKPGLNFNSMLQGANQGKIRAMCVAGADPVSDNPDKAYAENALAKLDFMVVQDICLSETARLADVVLPGASFAEKEGTFTNVERRIQKLAKAFGPIGNSKPDWYIICMLAQVLGHDFDYNSPAQVFEELAKVSPVHANLRWQDLGETGKRWEIT